MTYRNIFMVHLTMGSSCTREERRWDVKECEIATTTLLRSQSDVRARRWARQGHRAECRQTLSRSKEGSQTMKMQKKMHLEQKLYFVHKLFVVGKYWKLKKIFAKWFVVRWISGFEVERKKKKIFRVEDGKVWMT